MYSVVNNSIIVVPRRGNITTTTINIGIYGPCVFYVRSGTNQSYYLEYILRDYFAIFHREVKGRIVEVKSSQRN